MSKMMHDLAMALRVSSNGAGRYETVVAPHWDVWYPNGGYLAALAHSAIQEEATGWRVAALHCQFLRPASHGAAHLTVETLRAGSKARFLRSVLMQDGQAVLTCAATMILPDSEGFCHQDGVAPSVPVVQELLSHNDLVEDPGAWQSFWHNAEIRPCVWPESVESGPSEWRAWMRFKAESLSDVNRNAVQVAVMLMAADFGPYNAVVAGHESPPLWIAPNLDLYIQFYQFQDPEEWILIDSISPRAGGGLVGGVTKLWNPEGQLLATVGAQLFCMPNPWHAVQVRWLQERGLITSSEVATG